MERCYSCKQKIRRCLTCGLPLKQRDKEGPAAYQKRETCSRKCGQQLRHAKNNTSGRRHTRDLTDSTAPWQKGVH
jgi:hypothetical protein